jgi:hypothetical protein
MPQLRDPIQSLPERWRTKLTDYLSSKGQARLGAGDFSSNGLLIRFPDDSEVRFRYAFSLRDDEFGEIAVFTEHCGYHVFPGIETIVEIMI